MCFRSRLSFEVGTFDLVSVIFGGRLERDMDVQSRVKSFSLQGKFGRECLLLESLGRGTTASVVAAITAVILIDALFAVLFKSVGI